MVWCPDWPVVAAAAAAGIGPEVPVAVLAAGRVVVSSALARAEGVRRGLRKREAQGRCPELVVLSADNGRDAARFEPVVAAVESLAPGVEVVRPGVIAVPARGPVRYFGSEPAVAERFIDQVAAETGFECQVGIADGLFAATLAARRSLIVPPGRSADFLAPLGIGELDQPSGGSGGAFPGGPGGPGGSARRADQTGRAELVHLLRRLGLRTLGSFAALPARDVLSRFSADAALAHRLAAGKDPRPPVARQLPPDLAARIELDPPVERVDTAAFAARTLAERLHEVLTDHGLACTRLAITAWTASGQELTRTWRHEGVLSVGDIADRVRWQLDGWLTHGAIRSSAGSSSAATGRPTGGLICLQLAPEGVIEHTGLQLGLWGGLGEAGERAHRALARVQGLLGPEAVLTPVVGGGRGPLEQAALVPWQDERRPALPVDQPWPGRLPAPSPATVLAQPLTAEVSDATGRPVGVTGRHQVSAPPTQVRVDGRGPAQPVLAWAGPWSYDERWWDPAHHRRRVRFQMVVRDGTALLMAVESGRWSVEAIYD